MIEKGRNIVFVAHNFVGPGGDIFSSYPAGT
jgi:hypothetical protein